MPRDGNVTGWKLADNDRERLLRQFPPKYENVVADHVTLRLGAGGDTPLPSHPLAQVVGRADDGDSLECLVISLDGTTHRPDGSTFHITWSLGAGRKAKESNGVLRTCGWQHVDKPIAIDLEPARF